MAQAWKSISNLNTKCHSLKRPRPQIDQHDRSYTVTPCQRPTRKPARSHSTDEHCGNAQLRPVWSGRGHAVSGPGSHDVCPIPSAGTTIMSSPIAPDDCGSAESWNSSVRFFWGLGDLCYCELGRVLLCLTCVDVAGNGLAHRFFDELAKRLSTVHEIAVKVVGP